MMHLKNIYIQYASFYLKKIIYLYMTNWELELLFVQPLLTSTAVSDFLPGNYYIKTAEVVKQLIYKAAQPANVVRPLVFIYLYG